MKNAEWVNKRGYSFKDITATKCSCAGEPFVTIFIKGKPIETFKLTGLCTNDKLVLMWLDMEHKHKAQLLDDVEKKYLSAVIKPFRNEIRAIGKDYGWTSKVQRIYFYTKADETFYLKSFKTGTMYKGMETHKRYSLEELGL